MYQQAWGSWDSIHGEDTSLTSMRKTLCFPPGLIENASYIPRIRPRFCLLVLFIPADCAAICSLNDNSWDNLGTTWCWKLERERVSEVRRWLKQMTSQRHMWSCWREYRRTGSDLSVGGKSVCLDTNSPDQENLKLARGGEKSWKN